MATVVKVRRVVNPRKRRAKAKRKRNSRRRLTARQIKFFGTKAQKAALKRRRRAAPKRRKSVRVARKRVVRRRRARRARSNPALVVTLGAVNPTRRKKSMARRRRKSNKRRRSRNATRVVVMAPRRHNRRRVSRRANPHRRRRSVRRRNPLSLMGSSVSTTQMAKAVAGGLVGVAAAKFIPTMIPAQFVSSNIMRTLATGVSAWAASLVAKKVAGPAVGDAVLFGGLMQTGSVALNAFLPGVAKTLGISGFGELVDARFAVPENPLRGLPAAPAAANANVSVSGLSRAFSPAF